MPDFDGGDCGGYERSEMTQKLDRPDPLAPPAGYGEPAEQPQLDTICDVLIAGFVQQVAVRCAAGRDWVLTIGCDNEHIETVDVCDLHLHVLKAQQRVWACTPCMAACVVAADGTRRCPLIHPHPHAAVRILKEEAA